MAGRVESACKFREGVNTRERKTHTVCNDVKKTYGYMHHHGNIKSISKMKEGKQKITCYTWRLNNTGG